MVNKLYIVYVNYHKNKLNISQQYEILSIKQMVYKNKVCKVPCNDE